jgi:hypothetical protein
MGRESTGWIENFLVFLNLTAVPISFQNSEQQVAFVLFSPEASRNDDFFTNIHLCPILLSKMTPPKNIVISGLAGAPKGDTWLFPPQALAERRNRHLDWRNDEPAIGGGGNTLVPPTWLAGSGGKLTGKVADVMGSMLPPLQLAASTFTRFFGAFANSAQGNMK